MEYRIYSWRQDAQWVQRDAAAELAALGYHLRYQKDGTSIWKFGDREVGIKPGHSKSKREALLRKRQKEPGWVTVITGNEAPDTWITHIRYAVEPSETAGAGEF
ncbi:hypothetical protein OP10G_4752 [Fimbriimonas ginsengisoli Gsoil 348]|uniref:Uncharacterized protein n=2 Tax=Fimbriimonas ginsengisoli TaxID=1005039 RepID=A0A068NYG9_FIMGI|nr:hypothetical protein OP10G_4752 [Fimbriimonas ginsengisoli Gsoil 348]